MIVESLMMLAGSELSKYIFKSALEIGEGGAKDYLKGFLKGKIGNLVDRFHLELKAAIGEAIGEFIKLFAKELRDHDVSDGDIDRLYMPALKQFIKDKDAIAILGAAFEPGFKRFEGNIEGIWIQLYLPSGVAFPADFDWDLLLKSYQRKVKEIRRKDEKLRSILDSETLEQIDSHLKSIAPISPEFDVSGYRQSLQSSYGSLKLNTLDRTDRQYQLKLWQMFIEQNVRENLPPSRFELPQDSQQRLLKAGQLEQEYNTEQIEQYRRQYLEKSVERVLKVLGEENCQRAVVVGNPGSGKSTLLQYLALDWAEGKTGRFPLLIELQEYVNDRSPAKNFLDFWQHSSRADWKFDRHELHDYLRTHPSLVMFDGLDEIFNSQDYQSVLDEIANFATQQYPNAKIIVTSRIIGYNPDRLRGVNFRHFTLQELDKAQVEEFINKWHELALGADAEKEKLKQRIKDAIANSPAIQNLADNPLLLTMMAILNRRESLPRDRAELYDQASRVLLHNWDVDHKNLNLPAETIGRQEKQAMLRSIAYEMQSGVKGLAGNLIEADRLKNVLKGYLGREGYEKPREMAGRLIDQLRSRNFILCDRGGDTYGFVHRTFLEYFCATEIVRRFEKERSLSEKQLRDDVFGKHWEDKAWHEVLRLICGLLEPKWAGKLIDFLMEREVDRSDYLDDEKCVTKEAFQHLQLAAECLAEVRNPQSIGSIATKLKEKLKNAIVNESKILFSYGAAELLINSIGQYYHSQPEILTWLQNIALADVDEWVRYAAVESIGQYYHSQPETLTWLQNIALSNGDWLVRQAAVQSIGQYYHSQPEILTWLQNFALADGDKWVRQAAVESIGQYYHSQPEILTWLQNIYLADGDEWVRQAAVESISKYFSQADGVFELLCQVASQDPYRGNNYFNPRQTALEGLVKHYIELYQRSKIIELLRDRSTQDPDEKLRKWAEEQLENIVRSTNL